MVECVECVHRMINEEILQECRNAYICANADATSIYAYLQWRERFVSCKNGGIENCGGLSLKEGLA
jgi:hypothetical protein